jgi:hypothetical protein
MSAEYERSSLLCALVANCHSAKRRFKPRDFNPFERRGTPELSAEEAAKWLKEKLNG